MKLSQYINKNSRLQTHFNYFFGGVICVLSILLFWNIPAGWSLELSLPETAYQGDMIVGKTDPLAEVWLKESRQIVGPQGYFVLPVPRDQKTDIRVTAKSRNDTLSRIVRIWAYPWQTQKIKGLPPKYVSPSAKQQERFYQAC